MYHKNQQMAESNENPSVVTRVSQLPVVASASTAASQYYESAKESSSIVKAALDTAEKAVEYAKETAKPILNKLETPIAAADGFACKALDKLEEKCPIITKSPEEIAKETKELYNSTIQPHVDKLATATQYGVSTMNTVKDYGVQKATELMDSPYGQAVASSVTKTLNVADQYVDHYLPAEDQNKENTKIKAGDPMMVNVGKFSSKVKERVHKATINQVELLQARTRDMLSHTSIVLDLIEKTKSSLSSTNKIVKDKLTTAYGKGYELWLELNKENPTEDETENKTLEQKSLALARMLTQKLVTVYHNSSQTFFTTIPTSLQAHMSQAQTQATDLYNQVAQISKLEDVTSMLVNQVQEKSKLIQNTVTAMRDQMIPMEPLESKEKSEDTSSPMDTSEANK